MMDPRALSLGVLLLMVCDLKAQDTLVYRNGLQIIGQVEEVGTDHVRYRTISGSNSVVVVVERRELTRIALQNGQEFHFAPPTDTKGSQDFLARKNAIMLDILAPALDHATIGYERAVSNNVVMRFRVGYIGLWRSERSDERILTSGWLLRVGPRFKLPTSSNKYPHSRDTHPLAGWYLSPEILFSYYADPRTQFYYHNYYWENVNYTVTYTYRSSAALNLTIGRQVMLGDHFTFDIHGGLGYGVTWVNGVSARPYGQTAYGDDGYKYSHIFIGNTPLCANGGISFGYAFR